jgi:error-prone DNA polymerase
VVNKGFVYIELHASSAFSFLDGASLPAALVERAAELGYPAVALLDRDGLYGAPQFYRAARAAGLKAIVGAELTIGAQAAARGSAAPAPWVLPVLVESVEGYRNLCRLITRAKLKAPKGESYLQLEDLVGHTGGLLALAGAPALDAERHGVGGLVTQLVSIFGRGQVWIELQRHF